MKKVVYVVESFAGGVYTFLTELCNSAAEHYEVVIVYSLRKETPLNSVDDFDSRIRFIETSMCRGLNPTKNIKSLIQLKNILKIEHPDIIHLHSSKAGFLGRLACYANRFNMEKVFYNPHGFSFLQKNESVFKRKTFYSLEWFASKLGGYTVACSKGEFEVALQISKKCININNGIDTTQLDAIISDSTSNVVAFKKNNKIKIATVGRICYQKNPQLFNEIAKRFTCYDFIWIGDGELKQMLTAKNIKVTGWTLRKQVIEELIDIDIFILTSLWEGLPISLLEAMYIGKPVIVSNVMGNKDVVKHNFNGYIANNLNEYIEEIKHITSNNIILDNEFKNRVRSSILEEYDKNRMVKKYMDIYEFKKKILHLLSTKILNGAEKVALDICTNLDRVVFLPIVVCAGEELKGYFEREDIKTVRIDIGKLNIIEIFKLRRLIKCKRIDLIHAHDVRASIAAKLASINLNIKVLSHIHVEYDWLKDKSILKSIDRLFRNKYDLTLTCSEKVKEFYYTYNTKCNVEKIIALPNSFNFNEFNRTQITSRIDFKAMNNIPEDKYVFGYIGRLIDVKGIDLIIESFKLFHEKYSDSILIVVGDGVEKEKLVCLASEYNLTSVIYFMGYRVDVFNWLNIFDSFILPSKREGLPITILEAMAMKKIVISTKVGGIPELIYNNYNGILLEERTPNSLLKSMKYVYQNRNEVKEIEENAYKYLVLNYSIVDYIVKLQGVYKSL